LSVSYSDYPPFCGSLFMYTAITTVGYGEITPRSFLGKLLTLPLLVFGLLLIALPSFVLGREFSLVWEKMTKDLVNISI
jgi:potassium voltage-gated channel Shal-related subfamily D member 2